MDTAYLKKWLQENIDRWEALGVSTDDFSVRDSAASSYIAYQSTLTMVEILEKQNEH